MGPERRRGRRQVQRAGERGRTGHRCRCRRLPRIHEDDTVRSISGGPDRRGRRLASVGDRPDTNSAARQQINKSALLS